MRRFTLVLACGLLALSAHAAAAQTRPDSTARADTTVFMMGELVVTAARPATTTGGASALVVRPDSLAAGPVPTLESALRRIPMVQVRRNSRGEAQIGLRGSSERQVAVLLDGVPLSLGWDHRADLSVVPAGAARSITLVRGLSSVLHGPNVLGGVVEVGVAQGPLAAESPEPVRFSAAVEHTGTRALGADVARIFRPDDGELVVRAGAGYRSTPGLAAAPGVAEGYRDGRLRGNTDAENADAFAALRYRRDSGAWLSASGVGFRGERGVAPETHVESPRYWRYPEVSRVVGALSGGTGQRTTPWGEGDLEASVGVDLGHSVIEDYAGPDYRALNEIETADTRTATVRLLGDHTLGRTAELRGALTYADVAHDERIQPLSGPDGVRTPMVQQSRYRQRLWSAAAELAWRAPGTVLGLGGARVSGGLAWDGADTPESGDKPALDRLGEWGGRLGATALAGPHTLIHAGVSRRARFPALRELYSGALGKFEPNPDLRPEVLVAAEAGATWGRGGYELQAVGFHHRLSDAIVRERTPERRYKRVNRDELRSTGLELMGTAPLGRAALSGDLTLQRVRALDADGAESRPEYQPRVLGGLEIAAPVGAGWRGAAGVDVAGVQYCVNPDLGVEQRLDPSATLGLRATRGWTIGTGALSRVETSFVLDNATNATVYDQCGIAREGRTLRVEVRVR